MRKPIPKGLRFRVLERDRFTCRYCGAQPPDVVLHLDHVIAVAKGGENTFENLVTACLPCNIGKGVADTVVPSTGRAAQVGKLRPPPIEFFWSVDYSNVANPVMRDARCLLWPDITAEEAPWEWEEFNRYWNNHSRIYSTHGASTAGFSPYEAAMYAAEILHRPRWTSFDAYVGFVDDLLITAESGALPEYCAPFVLRALHIENVVARCGRGAGSFEYVADRMAQQAVAVFAKFLAREHNPWKQAHG